jgi:hypothetical protein
VCAAIRRRPRAMSARPDATDLRKVEFVNFKT